jgi:uncharacterized membrane protein (DUF373 family)
MAGYQTGPQEREDDITQAPETFYSGHNNSARQSGGRFVQYLSRLLNRTDMVVYALVGVCFLLAAIMALIYTFWDFGVSTIALRTLPLDQQPGRAAQAIIELVSGLLLVLIIMEMLGTVIHYLRVHTTSLQPFLFIGIVSATRSILSIGARLTIKGPDLSANEFNNAMIELGVSAAVILALGITLKLLGRLVEFDESR